MAHRVGIGLDEVVVHFSELEIRDRRSTVSIPWSAWWSWR